MLDSTESTPSSETGTAILFKGFRLFFVLAALQATIAIPIWVLAQAGTVSTGAYFRPTTWHAHEMVFGYTVAVIAGFLLTAVSNWTGQVTATGRLLAFLGLVWLAGRIAPLLPGLVPPVLIATLSLAFLPCLALVLGRVLVQARSHRNYKILGILGALFAAQLLLHLGVLSSRANWVVTGYKLAIDLIILLILIIAGRVIPLFTKNRTKAQGIRSYAGLDGACFGFVILMTILDAFLIGGNLFALVATLAALTAAARMVHWGLPSTKGIPLLWVLHIGYLFIPLGFLARAIAAVTPQVSDSVALHLLTAGAVGTLTLGMMARVSLGHTGRTLTADRVLTLAFTLVIAAALLRTIGPTLGGTISLPAIHTAAGLWTTAFALFLLRIGPSLFQARPDGKTG